MILKNFDVSGSIELQSGELFWDLHNFAEFLGLDLLPWGRRRCNEVELLLQRPIRGVALKTNSRAWS
jgi:hypothetical protein